VRRTSGSRRFTISIVAFTIPLCAVLFRAGPAEPQSAPPRAERIVIEYIEPTNSDHALLHHLLKSNRALERAQELLAPIHWPRQLRLELKGCDGESNAWYADAVVTVCYEYLGDMWKSANSPRRPPTISREDAFIGPLVDVFLHEAGHALFDLLQIPVLGREEDAADQVAAYFVLQLPKDAKRGLIIGAAYAYASELNVRSARDLSRRRLEVGRHITFADEHGTPAQRLYNLLCVAYGSDKELFADVVDKGFLPKERTEFCEDEYRQIDFAYRTLIAPHSDPRGEGKPLQ
jgi:Putative metallopeptidase